MWTGAGLFLVIDADVQDQERSGSPVITAFSSTGAAANNVNWTFDPSCSSTAVWDGGGADNNWSTAANWTLDTVPAGSDTATFNATSTKNCSIDVDVSLAGIDIKAPYSGTISFGNTAGGGLRGRFYDGNSFDKYWSTATDAFVNFNPSDTTLGVNRANGADSFSCRWTGQVLAGETGTYTFVTQSDDGVRLWVNGVQIINQWINQSARWTGAISLTAGSWYDLVLENYEQGGPGVIQLMWQTPSVGTDTVIPSTNLRIMPTLTVGASGYQQAGGTFNASSESLAVSGPFTHTGGTFNGGSGRVLLNSTVSRTLTVSGSPSFNNLDINDGLVAYWKFDDGSGISVTDHSGYGNHATLFNTEAADWLASSGPTALKFTNPTSFDFGGTDEFASAGAAGVPAANAAMSVSFWFYYVNMPAFGTRFLALSNFRNSSSVEIGFREDNPGTGTKGIEVWKWGPTQLIATNSEPVSNAWHHLAYTFDGTTHRLWVDGTAATNTTVAPNTAATTEVNIARWAANDNFFTGRLDDIRIYNRALSAAEVTRLKDGYQPATSIATQTLSGALDVNGSLTIGTGTLAAVANGVTVGGNWLNHGGLFTSSGTVTLDASSSKSIQSGNNAVPAALPFNNLVLNGSTTSVAWTPSDDMDVAGLLTITTGALDQALWKVTAGPAAGGTAVSIGANGIWRNLSADTGTTLVDVSLRGTVSNAGTVTFNGSGAG